MIKYSDCWKAYLCAHSCGPFYMLALNLWVVHIFMSLGTTYKKFPRFDSNSFSSLTMPLKRDRI